jgi:hypothetical protein
MSLNATPPPYVQRPLKDKSLALILELLLGLFGFLGIGWIYSNQTTTGILCLVGMFVWNIIAFFIIILTGGLGCFCTFPVNLAAVGVSAYLLNNYTQEHPELFG